MFFGNLPGRMRDVRALSVVALSVVSLFVPSDSNFANAEAESLEQATEKYKSEDYRRALKDCSLFLEHHPADNDALRLRGKCYLAVGEFDKAESDLSAAAGIEGPLEQAMKNQSTLDADDNDELNYPTWLQSLVLLYVARLHAEHGQYDKAIHYCDNALAKSPAFPECLLLRANILLRKNLLYESEEVYRQALSLRPKDWHAWLGYSYVLEKQVKYDRALDAIDRALILIKSPPYQEPDLDKRIDLMTKSREELRAKTNFRKS